MPTTTVYDASHCCCTTCSMCNGKVFKYLTADITATASVGCPGTGDSIVCDCSSLNADFKITNAGGCCWIGRSGTKTITCTDPISGIFTTPMEIGVEVCITYFDDDLVAAGFNYCSAAAQIFYTFAAGHYYVIGTASLATVSGTAGIFTFVNDLGTAKPDCNQVRGDLAFAYWMQYGGMSGDTEPSTFPERCTILALLVS